MREYLSIKMTAEEEVILLRQQLMALRKALATSDRERESVQKQLDKEVRGRPNLSLLPPDLGANFNSRN